MSEFPFLTQSNPTLTDRIIKQEWVLQVNEFRQRVAIYALTEEKEHPT